jgi:hypothetical protein
MYILLLQYAKILPEYYPIYSVFHAHFIAKKALLLYNKGNTTISLPTGREMSYEIKNSADHGRTFLPSDERLFRKSGGRISVSQGIGKRMLCLHGKRGPYHGESGRTPPHPALRKALLYHNRICWGNFKPAGTRPADVDKANGALCLLQMVTDRLKSRRMNGKPAPPKGGRVLFII